ncbi:phosphonate ABC transporter ATP-binding protein [Zoogloea sp.]|uniref:phosphonate ABC transporter ATP-binding protein n=1 Tax=Zoogloea sp. TaxID=49181 RepID=UPI001AC56E68|nr:phosphonate ABC transporter ATP-binding protein [Zoogloea sp.]MBN8285444.1 phosphonate ABC transporter ATP-binding protein [Zoogloea sp.]
MPNVVEIRNLTKRFGRSTALDDVSLSVAEGEMVALIGASGSGKSTLLRHLPGFLLADSGEVEILGRPAQANGRLARDIRDIRAEVGFVFQQFNLVGRLTVMTNVLVGLLRRASLWRTLLMRFSVSERQRALEALDAVGIAQTAWQRAATLSGGQQQRAAMARCLVQGARVVLADEPIASLDPESSRKVMELFATLNRDHGCAVIVCLHQVEFAIKYCPRTVALRAGKVVFDGPSRALTPALLGELYGADAHELFEPGVFGESPAANAPALPASYAAA